MDKRTFPIAGGFCCALVVAFAIFSRLLHKGFVGDDFVFLSRVPRLTCLGIVNPHVAWFYRPVFLAWFGSLWRVFGSNAVAFHAASIALHAVVSILAGILVYLLTRERWVAILCVVGVLAYRDELFTVSWISAASALLATAFALGAIIAWIAERRWIAIVCLALALASKEEAVFVLPVLICLHVSRGPLLSIWPAFVVVGLYAVLEVLAVHTYMHSAHPWFQPDWYTHSHPRCLSDLAVRAVLIVQAAISRLVAWPTGIVPIGVALPLLLGVTWLTRRVRGWPALWLPLACAPLVFARGCEGMDGQYLYLPCVISVVLMGALIIEFSRLNGARALLLVGGVITVFALRLFSLT